MTVVILGAGIGGLSTAYYLLKSKARKVIIVEASNRVGGWIQSEKQSDGVIFEKGPRTIRPVGEAGINTLNLISELDLSNVVRPIPKSSPAARNRFIYADGKLYTLPTGLKPFFCSVPPFSKPLSYALWHDLTSPAKYVEDDNIYDFVKRRFGKEFADYLISPLMCGICGGDAKEISVKFLLSKFFEKEQEYGSILKHYLRPWNWKIIGKYNFKEATKLVFTTDFEKDLKKWIKTKPPKKCDLEILAKKKKWTSYSLTEGLEILPETLREKIVVRGGTFLMNTKPVKLDLRAKRLILEDDNIPFDFVVSAIPSYSLAPLLLEDDQVLSKLLLQIRYNTIITVNLLYKKKLLHKLVEGFGLLVPPSENLPILGVIFDHSYAPVDDYVILTVMMGGHAFEKFFKNNCDGDFMLKVARESVAKILDIVEPPDLSRVSILRDCIPQQVVNHSHRISWMMNHIEMENLPLFLVGNAYKGTGINDVILSAKETAEAIENYGKSASEQWPTPRYIVDYL